MEDYEGLDFAEWSRRVVREQTGKDPSDDFREVEKLVREADGLSMKLSGGFNYSDAKNAHQDTKLSFHDLKDVARKGWLFAKDRLLEASSGQAIVTAVEKLARFLKRERLAAKNDLRVPNRRVVEEFERSHPQESNQRVLRGPKVTAKSNYSP